MSYVYKSEIPIGGETYLPYCKWCETRGVDFGKGGRPDLRIQDVAGWSVAGVGWGRAACGASGQWEGWSTYLRERAIYHNNGC